MLLLWMLMERRTAARIVTAAMAAVTAIAAILQTLYKSMGFIIIHATSAS